MYRSAFCHPFLSVGVSISFDVIILIYYNFIYFQDKDTFLRFYSRSFQTFSIYGCAASNADVVILIRVHENALNFVDSGSGEIDSGTEQYLSYIEVIHSVSHITITINIESSSFN